MQIGLRAILAMPSPWEGEQVQPLGEYNLLTATEQRRFRRYALQFPCVVRPKERRKKAAKSAIRVETKDISKGGLYFVAHADWKVGTAIECTIELPLQVFGGRRVGIQCRGKIARLVSETEGRIGVGATVDTFQFTQLKKSELGVRE